MMYKNDNGYTDQMQFILPMWEIENVIFNSS